MLLLLLFSSIGCVHCCSSVLGGAASHFVLGSYVDGRFGLTLIVYSINVFDSDSFYDAVATDVAAEPAVLLKRVGKPARTWRDCVELMTAALFTNGCVNSCSAVALVAGLMRKHCGSTNIHTQVQSVHTTMPPFPTLHTHQAEKVLGSIRQSVWHLGCVSTCGNVKHGGQVVAKLRVRRAARCHFNHCGTQAPNVCRRPCALLLDDCTNTAQ